MNLVTISEEDFIDEKRKVVRLNGRRHRHIREVHRINIGDELNVGLLGGKIGTGKIIALTDRDLQMEVTLTENPPVALPLTLILALPRPIVLQRILQTVSAMGVKSVVLLNSARVEKSYWNSPVLSKEKIVANLLLGLEQAKDTIMPEVLLRKQFKPFLEDELPSVIKNTKAIVAHPGVMEPCPRGLNERVTLAIGPEGGFVDFEIEKFTALGFKAVNVGTRILKVETSIPAIISRIF